MRRDHTKGKEYAVLQAFQGQMKECRENTRMPVSFPSVDAYLSTYASGNLADSKYWELCNLDGDSSETRKRA
jgi:hypothetical protein